MRRKIRLQTNIKTQKRITDQTANQTIHKFKSIETEKTTDQKANQAINKFKTIGTQRNTEKYRLEGKLGNK